MSDRPGRDRWAAWTLYGSVFRRVGQALDPWESARGDEGAPNPEMESVRVID
jgi:hypothetical protein